MRTVFASTACLLLLAGCGAAKRVVLQPAEVLHRSVVASNTLDSFSYALDAEFETAGTRDAAAMTGSLHLTGSLLRERTIATGIGFVNVRFAGDENAGPVELRIDGAYAMVPHQRPALRMDSISTVSGAVMVQHAAGERWISLPIDDSPTPMESAASIDQPRIALQSSAMQVTKDLGIEKFGGNDVYHYQVALNMEALETMFGTGQDGAFRETLQDRLKGELWIDADSFLLRRAAWSLEGVATPRGSANVHADVSVFDQKKAVAKVTPPMANRIEYPDDGIFATIFSGALLPFLSR
ncbi:MAG TPA: hypothetical protein PKV72_04615 [Candidatus Peribacteria bacterium]|nr:hypothetical protein [Candidatus Peribacteria bacterium]